MVVVAAALVVTVSARAQRVTSVVMSAGFKRSRASGTGSEYDQDGSDQDD